MDGKKIIIGSIAGIVLVAGTAFITDYRRKSIDAGELDRQLAILDNEHRERQRSLEENLGELGELSENAIAALEGAGAIVERTGSELRSAASDLRSARSVLADLAKQIEDLQSEFDDCRSNLYRIRSLAGVAAGE
jgi:chromosome segregation ATPase